MGGGGGGGEWGTKVPISLNYLAQGEGQGEGVVFPPLAPGILMHLKLNFPMFWIRLFRVMTVPKKICILVRTLWSVNQNKRFGSGSGFHT